MIELDKHSKTLGLSTDDGYLAVGYRSLVGYFSPRTELVAAASDTKYTSYGTATGSSNGKLAQEVLLVDAETYVLQAFPAAVVNFLSDKLKSPKADDYPSIIITGVNHGPNVGENLIHSGTFCGAVIATWRGHSGLAVSLDDVYSVCEDNPGDFKFERAASYAWLVFVAIRSASRRYLVNINMPNSDSPPRFVPSFPEGSQEGGMLQSDVSVLRSGQASLTVFHPGSFLVDKASTESLAGQLNVALESKCDL